MALELKTKEYIQEPEKNVKKPSPVNVPRNVVRGLSTKFWVIFTVHKDVGKKVEEGMIENKFYFIEFPPSMPMYKSWKVLVTLRRGAALKKVVDNICKTHNCSLYD